MEIQKLSPEQQEKLNGQKKWLVERADLIGEAAAKEKDWKNQIRILIEACREETEPEVILHLLRYQAARVKKTWKIPVAQVEGARNTVAEVLEDDLRNCQELAADNVLAIALMQHLCCYAYRSYTHFSSPSNGSGDAGASVDETQGGDSHG
jgi:hypothetical protein